MARLARAEIVDPREVAAVPGGPIGVFGDRCFVLLATLFLVGIRFVKSDH